MNVLNNIKVFVKYGYRQHKSCLDESLKTSVAISSRAFENMLKTGRFSYYCFDDRCNQLLWLSEDTGTWLFAQIELCQKSVKTI